MKTTHYLIICLSFIINQCSAQFVFSPVNSGNVSNYATNFGSPFTTYPLNVSLTGSNFTLGYFKNGQSIIGIDSGFVLTSGSYNSINNPSTSQIDVDNTIEGDADLQTLTLGTIRDVAKLEFDFIAKTDTLKFRIVFASEEYPEYVCSPFNDIMGVFVTGPDPAGGSYNSENVALIPHTSFPIGINSINPGTPGISSGGGLCTLVGQSLAFDSLYNQGNTSMIFDGYTVAIDMEIPLVVCGDYHIKFAIADINDGVFDSGLFIGTKVSGRLPHLYASTLGSYSGVDSTLLCIDDTLTLTSPIATTYNWGTFGNTQSIVVTSPGNYQVINFNPNNGCIQASYTYRVITDPTCTVNTEIVSYDMAQIKIYPNPSAGKIIVEGLPSTDYIYEVSDLAGRLIHQETGRNKEENDLNYLNKGIYLFTVKTEQGSKTFRLIKSE